MMKANKKMRKNMIKKASMTALAATLSLSAALPAFAATLDFSGESNTGHSYNVYQIFTGKFEEVEGNKELKEMYYGVDAKAYVAGEEKRVDSAVITELEGVSGKTTAEILKVVEAYAEIDGSSFQTAKAGDVLTDIPDGYYLIEDAEAPSNGDSFTTYVVKVVGGTIKVTPKTDKPGFDKQVLDNEKDDVTE
ncbi:MAG: hypothetical protein Q4B22_10945, partial [Eubacteriales bacterium]|nr:hypothetical protein [Eubacteriales bacterium]